MNSTGVKLNAQELRNAEFYGLFKTCAYEIATEQLNRWRDWNIFTPDQIARMNEVELTSEFMLLILNGTLRKNNKAIDKFYDDYDQSFDDRQELTNRFRTIFETIASLFPKEVLSDLFSNRTLFYSLFVAIYGLQYGLRSPVSRDKQRPPQLKREKPHPIKPEIAQQIIKVGAQIKSRNVSERVIKALRGATTDASERRVIIRLLVGKEDDPCPVEN